jgi:hypothetical protein
VRDRPGEAQGTFTAQSFQVSGSYARGFSEDLTVGITARFLYEKLFVDQASGVAFDLGGRWKTPLDSLTLGGAVANLGKMSSLRTSASKLPALCRAGLAYTLGLEGAESTIAAAIDGLYLFPEAKPYGSLGGEFVFDRLLALRAGYQFGSESRGFSAGIGITYGLFELQYAYVPLMNDLGTTSTFTLGVRF